jgi:hypothetical protein
VSLLNIVANQVATWTNPEATKTAKMLWVRTAGVFRKHWAIHETPQRASSAQVTATTRASFSAVVDFG